MYFFDNVIEIMNADEWSQYKSNMPVLNSSLPAPAAQSKIEYEGGTKYFQDLRGRLPQGAISFMLTQISSLDEGLLQELLADEIQEVLTNLRQHQNEFKHSKGFAVGKLHRIQWFHIYPEPRTVTQLMRNDIRAQTIIQVENMLNRERKINLNLIRIDSNLQQYLQMIRSWYATYNGMKDRCEDLELEFGYLDGVPLI